MSSPLRKQNNIYTYSYPHYQTEYSNNITKPLKRKAIKRKPAPKRKSFLATLFSFAFLCLFGYYVAPYAYNHFFSPLYLNRFLNRNIHLKTYDFIKPTSKYIHNSYVLDKYVTVPKALKSKEISDIQILNEMTSTKAKLKELFAKYPHLHPSVFVWEYQTSSGFEINADEVFPSASIIKVPIAFELIRLIDETSNSTNPIKLDSKRMFTETYRTSGSGKLQTTKANTEYTLNHLANIMIAESDNSATNMILNEIGGMDGFNRSMRNYGFKTISMGQWLPDLEGHNKITAREISKVFYNIDNPVYINPKYRAVLKEYLGNTKNIHLIKEKLPLDSMVLHKTGDIGTMLGDSGIVYTDNAKKYIVTILVKRPHNDYGAKNLIQEASLIIYNDIKALQ